MPCLVTCKITSTVLTRPASVFSFENVANSLKLHSSCIKLYGTELRHNKPGHNSIQENK